MEDGTKVWAGIAASLVIIFSGVALIMATDISMVWFWTVFVIGLAVMFLPFLTLKGDWVTLQADHIEIRAPMAKLDIPYSSITAVDCV